MNIIKKCALILAVVAMVILMTIAAHAHASQCINGQGQVFKVNGTCPYGTTYIGH